MSTIIRGRKSGAVGGEGLAQLRGDFFETLRAEEPLTDSRLIGNDDHRHLQRGEISKCLSYSGNKDKLGPIQYVISGPPAIDDSIAVDKNGAARVARSGVRKDDSQQAGKYPLSGSLAWPPGSDFGLRFRGLEQHFLSDLADNMTSENVALLNSRSFLRRNANRAVHQISEQASRRPRERNRKDRLRLRGFHRPDHVA